jgi:hypothetical protein
MATNKVERAGIGFGIRREGGSNVLEVRTHHDTISSLRGIRLDFELLNGITAEQAKKISDVLNENIIGVLVTTLSGNETASAR